MSIKRARLSPDQSRRAAMEAARALLIEAGPQAVTLKAVASRIDRTHANLLHHFGSAAGLQKALAAHLAETITASIGETVEAARRGEVGPRAIVDMTFDAFDAQEPASEYVAGCSMSGKGAAPSALESSSCAIIPTAHSSFFE